MQSPLLALVVFGAYLAAALLYGVLTFRTVPAEAALLNKVRNSAGRRAELGARPREVPGGLDGAELQRPASSWLKARALPQSHAPFTQGTSPCCHCPTPQDIARAKADLAKRGVKY